MGGLARRRLRHGVRIAAIDREWERLYLAYRGAGDLAGRLRALAGIARFHRDQVATSVFVNEAMIAEDGQIADWIDAAAGEAEGGS